MAYMNMKKSTIITALTTIMMMAVTPAFAQEEDNGEHQLSGFKKFNVREDFTENGFQWFHDAELLAAGDKESGITIHLIDERYDCGTTFFQATCPVLPTDTPHDVAQKVHALEYEHFPHVIAEILATLE